MKIATFIEKALGRVNAAEYLNKHREFLLQFPKIAKVISFLDTGKIFPTQALHKVLSLIMKEKDPLPVPKMKEPKVIKMKVERLPKEPKTPKEPKPKRERIPKRYQLFLFRKDGSCTDKPLEADLYQDAWRMANRTLFNNLDLTHIDIIGMSVMTRINRTDAITEILKKSSGPACKTKPKSSDRLGFKVSAKNYVPKFSRG